MPIYNYAQYMAGFVPYEDVQAQLRCFAYLKKAVTVLDREIAHNRSQALMNQRRTFETVISMTDVASGSRRLGRANTFWHYWDTNKRAIFEVNEGSTDDYAFQNKISELEEGRYIQA